MTAALIRACIPSAAPTPTAPPFDATAATRQANDQAMAELAALPANATIEQTLRALNLIVVNFDSGSTAIPGDAQPVLARAAQVIAALPPNVTLQIVGHTDDTGTAEANLALSLARAQAVLDFLVAAGVPAGRLTATGRGDTKPVASNATAEGRFRNRRIEFAAAS
jgi:OOP family OmpA-OmpF porin